MPPLLFFFLGIKWWACVPFHLLLVLRVVALTQALTRVFVMLMGPQGARGTIDCHIKEHLLTGVDAGVGACFVDAELNLWEPFPDVRSVEC